MKYYLCECTVIVGQAKSRTRVITSAESRDAAIIAFSDYFGSGSHITLFVTEVKLV